HSNSFNHPKSEHPTRHLRHCNFYGRFPARYMPCPFSMWYTFIRWNEILDESTCSVSWRCVRPVRNFRTRFILDSCANRKKHHPFLAAPSVFQHALSGATGRCTSIEPISRRALTFPLHGL